MTDPSSKAIELEDLRKEFISRKDKVLAVDGLTLAVERGEVFGLLGPNGAGKTTTVEICEGLQRQTSGSVRVLGMTWDSAGDAQRIRQNIGVSLQETRFFDKLTVRETLQLFRSFYERGRTVDEALDVVALHEKADSRTMNLSGGQRQRLAVATALVGEPELLFLDEPTTGLDPQSRRSLWEVVREFQQRGGTVLLTTHYMEEAEQLCDRVGVVDAGKLIALGSPSELIRSLDGGHVIEVHAEGVETIEEGYWHDVRGVRKAIAGAGWLRVTVDAPHESVPALMTSLEKRSVEMSDLHTRHTSLEDVFVALTGRSIEDAEAAQEQEGRA